VERIEQGLEGSVGAGPGEAPPAAARLALGAPELLRGAAYINGIWLTSERRIEVEDPADGSVLASVPNLGEQETRDAIAAAHAALPEWRNLTSKARAEILRAWHGLMVRHQEDLARLLTAEQGKPLAEARAEVAYAAGFLEWFAEEARRVNGELLSPHLRDKRLLVMKQPVGVVAAITPWNFPLAMITRKAGPALAAGCSMIVKPSELTPLSALALAYLGEQAGLPAGVFNVVTGDPAPIGATLADDSRVRKLTFTGSTAVGKMLAARCMATVKRVSLELGGNAPFIVFEDADLDAAVEGAIASKFRNSGQTCVCANRLLVQSSIHDEFAHRLAKRAGALLVGAGLGGPTDQGPLISAAAVDKARAHVADAVAGGGRLLCGGTPLDDRGRFFAPTVIADVAADALLCREETFAPVAGIVRFADEAQAIELANNTTAGLAAYVYTADQARSWRVIEALEYGMVGLNTGLISTEVAPFGGIKESGLGREGSSHGIDEYLELKLACMQVQP